MSTASTTATIEFNVAKTFGLPAPAALTLPGYAEPQEGTPVKDPLYKFSKDTFRSMMAWYKNTGMSDGFYLFGPTGSGKTSFVNQFFAYLNTALNILAGHNRLWPEDLFGRHEIIGGETVFVYSSLANAAMRGEVLLITEGDQIPPETNVTLNSILDGYPIVITANGGEKIYPKPGFRIIYDGNTSGHGGDFAHHYRGAKTQNLAFMDRFATAVHNYPDPAFELEVLMAKSSLPQEFLERMINVANAVRNMYMDEDNAIDFTMSTRTLLRWANYALTFSNAAQKDPLLPITTALELSMTARCDAVTRQAIDELVQREFGGASVGAQTAAA